MLNSPLTILVIMWIVSNIMHLCKKLLFNCYAMIIRSFDRNVNKKQNYFFFFLRVVAFFMFFIVDLASDVVTLAALATFLGVASTS